MGKDAATQPGAADGKDKPAASEQQGRPIQRTGRMEMLDSIGRHRNKTFNDEQRQAGSEEFVPEDGHELKAPAAQGGEDDDVDPDDIAAEKDRARIVREAEEADKRERKAREAKSEIDRQLDADDRVTVIDDPSKFKVRMKVDGEERVVDLADMTRTAQKEAAADRRLEQAAQMMKAAEAREAAAAAKLSQADDATKAKAERDLKVAQEAKDKLRTDLREKAKKHAELLYDGKTDEAAEMYAEMMAPMYERSEAAPTHAPAPSIDMKALKAEIKQDLKTESALETFNTGYPEIVADPHLAAIADRYFDAALKEGKSEADAFKAAGENTRGYVKGLAKNYGMSEGRTTTTGRESLTQRKEKEIDEPSSASSAVSLKDTSSAEPTPVRSVIAEMAAMRPGAAAAAAAARRNGGG